MVHTVPCRVARISGLGRFANRRIAGVVSAAAVLAASAGWVGAARAGYPAVTPEMLAPQGLPLPLPEVRRTGVITSDPCGPGCGKYHAVMAMLAADVYTPELVVDLSSRDGNGAGNGSGPTGSARMDAIDSTDIEHVSLDIEVFPSTQNIAGSNTMRVRSLVDNLTTFTFRLRNQFTASATADGVNAPVATTSTTTRTITLPQAYNAGEVFTLRIAYSGQALSRGLGSIEFDTTSAGETTISSLSQPWYAYTWWPIKDGDTFEAGDNADKFTFDIAITTPSALRATSSGTLTSVTPLPNSRTRYSYSTRYEVPSYLVSFSAAQYNTWTRTFTYDTGNGVVSMPVEFNIWPSSDTPQLRAAWETTLPMLRVFSDLLGLYPFIDEKYGIYAFTFGGGMEHQTNSGQGTSNIAVTAHELAHQWLGDHITCRTWADIWLNEGGASFGEILWEEFQSGASSPTARAAAANARRPDPASAGQSVYVNEFASVGRVFDSNTTYEKGGWVYHMLRGMMGDETFFAALRGYRARYGGGVADTEEFRATMEDISGLDLANFFNQWVYSPGRLDVAFGFQNVTIDGQTYVRLRTRQTQSGAYPTYDQPVQFRFNGAASTTATLRLNERAEHFLIPVNGNATGVTVDPNSWVLITSTASEAYTAGPPKAVSASIQPDAVLTESPASIRVVFSDAVAVAPGAVTLSGPNGPVQIGTSLSGTALTVAVNEPLAPGAYALTLGPGITAGGLALDGELAADNPAQPFPTGDGLAGGSTVLPFTFAAGVAPCPADFNADTTPGDIFDLFDFLSALDTGLDYNNDASPADIFDLFDFLAVLDQGCP